MKAIWTKSLGPTDHRGPRVRAVAEHRNGFGAAIACTVEWDDSKNSDENHDAAAVALCLKMGWPGDLTRGGRPDGAGNVYTFLSGRERVHNPTPSYAEQEAARSAAVARINARQTARGIVENVTAADVDREIQRGAR